jgi:uncharacterized protein
MSQSPPWGEPPAQPVPQYQPPAAPPQPQGTLVCPKCRGAMRTYERNGIHLEQCDSCRGIFLDFGELESLTRLEARISQPPPGPAPAPQQPSTVVYTQPQPGYGAGYGPGWGQHGHHKYRKHGFGRLFFSS